MNQSEAARSCCGDVADAGQVEAAAARVEREPGPIDVWVNQRDGLGVLGRSRAQADEFKRVTEVTYLGVVPAPQRRSSGCCRATRG